MRTHACSAVPARTPPNQELHYAWNVHNIPTPQKRVQAQRTVFVTKDILVKIPLAWNALRANTRTRLAHGRVKNATLASTATKRPRQPLTPVSRVLQIANPWWAVDLWRTASVHRALKKSVKTVFLAAPASSRLLPERKTALNVSQARLARQEFLVLTVLPEPLDLTWAAVHALNVLAAHTVQVSDPPKISALSVLRI